MTPKFIQIVVILVCVVALGSYIASKRTHHNEENGVHSLCDAGHVKGGIKTGFEHSTVRNSCTH